jgi:hypothetical protein
MVSTGVFPPYHLCLPLFPTSIYYLGKGVSLFKWGVVA